MHWPPKDAKKEEARVVAGDLFGIQFDVGWVVFRALTNEVVPKDHIAGPDAVAPLTPGQSMWPAIPGGEARGPIDPTTGVAGPLPGILRLGGEVALMTSWLYHDMKNYIWQAFMGIDQPQTYVYREFPVGDKHGALGDKLGPSRLTPTQVSTWGWTFGGWESMYGDERVASMWFIPPGIETAMGIYNWSSQARTPKSSHEINIIEHEPLDPRDKKDARLIEDVLKNRIKAVKWTPGWDRFVYRPKVKQTFGVEPVVQTKREILVAGTPMEVE